jgi:hypothetical protein
LLNLINAQLRLGISADSLVRRLQGSSQEMGHSFSRGGHSGRI